MQGGLVVVSHRGTPRASLLGKQGPEVGKLRNVLLWPPLPQGTGPGACPPKLGRDATASCAPRPSRGPSPLR